MLVCCLVKHILHITQTNHLFGIDSVFTTIQLLLSGDFLMNRLKATAAALASCLAIGLYSAPALSVTLIGPSSADFQFDHNIAPELTSQTIEIT